MTLRLLGGATLDGPLTPDLSLWLCAVLAVRGGALSREHLISLLWPEAGAGRAHNRLRQLLHRTRRTSLGAGLQVGGSTLRWAGDSDVRDFRAAWVAGHWDEAVRIYAGPLLDGLPAPESAALDDWLREERAHLHGQYLTALARAAEAHETAGRLAQAAERFEALLVADPLHEEAVSALMRCLSALGSPARALVAFERYRREIAQAFGVEPSPALSAQAHQLRRHEPARPAGLRGAPQPFTRFLGREREQALVVTRLSDPDCRWLSLVGPGGVGKTRLALEAAAELAPAFGDGALFVPLAGSDAAHLAQGVLAALGEELRGGAEPDEQLAERLRGRELLLVLDTFEHLQARAGLLADLLRAAPRLKLLVTTRHRLNFQAEWVLRLSTLEVEASGDAPLESAAARLFIERARRADAAFEPARHAADILRICRRCEGLPLALELAAAWVGTHSLPELAEALERDWNALSAPFHDQEGRHRSLSGVFDHAWQLLPTRLRAVYAALAVLRTPFGLAVAAQVAGASHADLLDLERRSLLQGLSGSHWSWHQNLREFAWAQLDGTGQRVVQGRHLAHFRTLARETAPRLHGPQQAEALSELAAVHDDLRAALASAEQLPDHAAGLDLAGQLHWFWYVRGHHAEGLHWLDSALRPFENAQPSPALSLALKASGALASERGEYRQAWARYGQALSAVRTLSDPSAEAEVRHLMGVLARDTGDLGAARAHLEAALALRENLNDASELGTTLNDLGILSARTGDREAARALFRRSLAFKEQAGDLQGVAYALANLGAVVGDLDEELRLYQQSLAIKRELGDVQGMANSTFNCAIVASELGDLAAAQQHHIEALTLFRELGKYLHLGSVLAEVAAWLELVSEGAAARRLAACALALEAPLEVPLRDQTREQLMALRQRQEHHWEDDPMPDLTPDAVLDAAIQSVRAARPPVRPAPGERVTPS